MKTVLSLLLAFVVATLVSGCGNPAPEAVTSDDAPAVGVLKTVNYEITLHTTDAGPLYTLRDKDGKQLAEKIDKGELASRFPEIHEEMKSLWAGNEAGSTQKAAQQLPASVLDGLKEAIEP